MKTVILVSGKLQSGKNTFADLVKEYITDVVQESYAGPLKNECKEVFSRLTDYLNSISDILDVNLHTTDDNWYENKTPLTRILLQTYGTDIFRNKVSESWWLDKLVERIKLSQNKFFIITDVRYQNEIDRFTSEDVNVFKIRVERTKDYFTEEDLHGSETGLDNYKNWDYKIQNDGSIDDLRKVAKMITQIIKG